MISKTMKRVQTIPKFEIKRFLKTIRKSLIQFLPFCTIVNYVGPFDFTLYSHFDTTDLF